LTVTAFALASPSVQFMTLDSGRATSPGHRVRWDGSLPFTTVRLIEIALVSVGTKAPRSSNRSSSPLRAGKGAPGSRVSRTRVGTICTATVPADVSLPETATAVPANATTAIAAATVVHPRRGSDARRPRLVLKVCGITPDASAHPATNLSPP
jgi:hypothetical protein